MAKKRVTRGRPNSAESPVSAREAAREPQPVLAGWIDALSSVKVIVSIALVSFLTFANSLGGRFVYDDIDQIVNNPSIRSWSNVLAAFYTHVWEFRQGPQFLRADIPPPYYRPIFTLLITVEYHLFGLWPQGWHIVSIALHAVCGIAAYYVLMELFGRKPYALIAALVFVAYPLHAEPVSWISGVTDPLCGAFLLTAFYFYLRYRKTARVPILIVSLVLFLASILSKETGLSLAVLVFAYELVPKRDGTNGSRGEAGERNGWGGWSGWAALGSAGLRSAPFLGIGILSLVPRAVVLGGLTWSGPFMHKGPITDTFLTLPLIIWTYVGHLIWPVGLTVAYHTHFVTTVQSLEFLLPFSGLVLALVGLSHYRKRISSEVWMSLIFILVPLLPVFDLRHLSEEYLIFDRYLYLSVLGVGCLVAICIEQVDRRARNWSLKQHGPYLAAAGAVVFCVAMAGSVFGATRENLAWRDPLSLWANAARHRPDFWVVRYNLGLALMGEKRYDEALAELKAAANLNPTEPSIFDSAGRAYQSIGSLKEASESFDHALAIDPNFFESLNNLGTVYFQQGDYAKAQLCFERAVSVKPAATQARYNLAKCYESQSRDQDAINEFQEVLRELPNDADTYYELGLVYEKLNRRQEAVQSFQRGLDRADTEEVRDRIHKALSSASTSN